jgi:flagella basal body P-ring formation protein FlgA
MQFRSTLFLAGVWALALASLVRGETVLMQNTAPTQQEEQYVPRSQSVVARVEIRDDATVYGNEITLKQICRWPDADEAAMSPLAELVIARIPSGQPQATVSLDQVRSALRDAGASIATINFAGAFECTVTRSDVAFDEQKALQEWASGKANAVPDAADVQATLATDAVTRQQQQLHSVVAPAATGTLRSLLVEDIATRLKLPVEDLQVDFRPDDRATIELDASRFQFRIETQRGGQLGDWRWTVTVDAGAQPRRLQVLAKARAWQDQVVLTRPVAFRSAIDHRDVESRRVLVDRLGDVPATLEATIGSAAARDLQPGMVVTGRMITPVELVRSGQLVTVTMRRGGIEIQTVATAIESGSLGQMIRVRNNATREQLDVQLVGPQQAVAGDAITTAKAE